MSVCPEAIAELNFPKQDFVHLECIVSASLVILLCIARREVAWLGTEVRHSPLGCGHRKPSTERKSSQPNKWPSRAPHSLLLRRVLSYPVVLEPNNKYSPPKNSWHGVRDMQLEGIDLDAVVLPQPSQGHRTHCRERPAKHVRWYRVEIQRGSGVGDEAQIFGKKELASRLSGLARAWGAGAPSASRWSATGGWRSSHFLNQG